MVRSTVAPVPEHIDGSETQSPVAADHERRIASAVPREMMRRRVELESVDFDEETVVDKHVHPADVIHHDLLTNIVPPELQPLAREGLHP